MDSYNASPSRTMTVDMRLVERLGPWALGSVALSALSTAIATFQFVGDPSGTPGDTSDWLLTIFVALATAAISFWAIYGASTRGAHLNSFAAIFGVLALATCAIFWSGIPIVLGAAAIVAGIEVMRARTVGGERRRVAEAGMAMGAIAIPLAFVFCLMG